VFEWRIWEGEGRRLQWLRKGEGQRGGGAEKEEENEVEEIIG
jgi:hypothetical protein